VAWLVIATAGLCSFSRDEVLRALFDEHGDKEMFEWTEGDALPVARA